MNEEKIKAWLMIIGWILLNIFLLWSEFGDYVYYNNHKSEYTVYYPKIVRISWTGRGNSFVYFEYEINGRTTEGYVNGGLMDEKGKQIKVAFDKNMKYIRAEIVVSWHLIVVMIMTVLTFISVVFPVVYDIYLKFKKFVK